MHRLHTVYHIGMPPMCGKSGFMCSKAVFICSKAIVCVCPHAFFHTMCHIRVSFAEYSLFCRALLQKRPLILRSLLIEATTYHVSHQDCYVWYIMCGISVLMRSQSTIHMPSCTASTPCVTLGYDCVVHQYLCVTNP
jgi:hypothetical protein